MANKKELAAEFIGSMFLVLASVASMVMFTHVFYASKGVAVLANAVAVGFVLIALIEVFGGISGAHFNPVVTMVMLLDKKITTAKAALYVIVQFIGGIAGVVAANAMFQSEIGMLLAVSDNMRSHTFLGEVFGTFILVLAIILLVKAGSQKISIIIGMLVGGMLLSTSSTMFANPQVTVARMLTPTASGIRPVDGLVFIAMQVLGALVAFAAYKLIFDKERRKAM
ncbi:MAG: aquaporin [Defluviitaleaceae bacterium]|nr:aquaporin [Defluviitaleaceae bacterium]